MTFESYSGRQGGLHRMNTFILPTGFLVTPEAPLAERDAVLKAAGQGGEQIQLVNNVTVIRKQSEVILVDAGTGPRHQPRMY
jgi:hypothetical protein